MATPSAYLIEQQALEVIIRSCSVGISPRSLEQRGICKQLRERLSTALGRDIEDDHELLTRLGKAKYHTLTPGARFREQKRKPKRKPSTSHSDDELAGENDLSSRIIAEEEDLCSRIISEVHDYLHEEDLCSRIISEVHDYLHGPPEEMESSSDEDLSHPPLVQDRRRDDELHALANDGMVVQPDSCEQGGAGSSS